MNLSLKRVLTVANVVLLLTCALPVAAQIQSGGVADPKVVLVKNWNGMPAYEQHASWGTIPTNSPSSNRTGAGSAIRALSSDGDQWFTIRRQGNQNCFTRYISYDDLTNDQNGKQVCNALTGDGYRGLATDGHLFYTLYWDATSQRHFWASYRTWEDAIVNNVFAYQTNARVGDVYRGIAFDPSQRVFLSLAQSGADVWLIKYATFADLVTVNSIPGGVNQFRTGNNYAGLAIGPVNPTLDILLVAGQSNAVGWAADGAGLESHPADAQTQFFYRIGSGDDISSSTSGNVTTLAPQASMFRNNVPSTSFGPEVGAIRKLYDSGMTQRMAVVKVAMGGTDLYNQWSPYNADGLFQLLQRNLSNATAQWNAKGYRTRIVGLLWMQGESDSLNANMANAYGNSLNAFTSAVRQIAGDTCMPVVLGRIKDSNVWTYRDAVRNAQKNFAANDKCAAWVDTDDLEMTTNPNDYYHYSTRGIKDLGTRMGDAYLRIVRR